MSRKVINGIVRESTDARINGISDFFATEGDIVVNGQEHYDFFRRYGVSANSLKGWWNQAAITAGISLATWSDLSGLANDMKQATASYQPSISDSFQKDASRDFDGSDDFMHQEIYDTKQGNMTFVADGGSAEFRDDGQDFSDWETASGNAAYMLVVTTNNGVSWGYMGEANNSNQDIDIYSDIALTTRGWKVRTTPQATPDTPASYEVLNTVNQITTALSAFMWVKPDDGQPTENNIFIQKWTSGNFKSYFFQLLANGKIQIGITSDGSTAKTNNTSAVIFSGGAQSNFMHIGTVFDGNASAAYIYINGVAVATTEGIDVSSIYDSYTKLTIGEYNSGNYFAGLVGPGVMFERAVIAGEASKLFNTDRARFGL